MDRPRSDRDAITASTRNPGEFGLIFDRHFDAINVYLRRQLGSDLGDELSSQTFLVAFDKRGSFDLAYDSARPWLFGIAANLVRGHHREVRRCLHAYARTGVDPALDAFEGVEERLDAREMSRELAGALARLNKEDLEALLLYAWGDLTYPEIAETLGVPVGTIRSRLHRARRQIREPLLADISISGIQNPEAKADGAIG